MNYDASVRPGTITYDTSPIRAILLNFRKTTRIRSLLASSIYHLLRNHPNRPHTGNHVVLSAFACMTKAVSWRATIIPVTNHTTGDMTSQEETLPDAPPVQDYTAETAGNDKTAILPVAEETNGFRASRLRVVR